MLRAIRGWSQADLAERLGVSRQTVNAIETGKYDPSLPLAFAIARLFGQRIEDIFDPGDGASGAPGPATPPGDVVRQPAQRAYDSGEDAR